MRELQIRLSLMVAVVTVAAMFIGCATTPVGPTPTEEVTAALADSQAAWQAHDLEKIIAGFSGDYSNSQGLDKSGLRGFFEGLAAQGILQSITMGIEACEIVVDGDSATATPITYDAPTGKTSYQYTLKKEADGVWRFINSEQIY